LPIVAATITLGSPGRSDAVLVIVASMAIACSRRFLPSHSRLNPD
jgi:hypothetical protein